MQSGHVLLQGSKSDLTKDSMGFTNEDVLRALSEVQEPDLGKDLVTLNMVQDIKIDGEHISFTVVLTTPACPLKEMIEKACINAIRIMVSPTAVVKVNM